MVSDTEITCRLPGGSVGEYYMRLKKYGVGYAANMGENFILELTVSSISPLTGSIEGGTVMTVTGTNFSPILKQN